MLGACVSINTDAILHNVSLIKACASDRSVMWMLKCNAYGHGLDAVLPHLPMSDTLGLASLQEAKHAFDLGVEPARVLLMRGFLDVDESDRMCKLGMQVVMHADYQWDFLKASVSKGLYPSAVWLHVDTGMSRLGVSVSDFDSLYLRLKKSAGSHFPVHVMTHLASADRLDSVSAQAQLDTFSKLDISGDSKRCALNSAGLAHYPLFDSDCIRPGIALYGISPLAGPHPLMDALRPVMTFTAPVIAVKSILKGQSVGYGDTWLAKRDSIIAICAVGYGDGYPREITEASVFCRGQLCPVVGRVSMDFIAIDVSDHLEKISAGDRVELWGEQLSAERVAKTASTIPYTLFTGVSARVTRLVGGDDDS